MREPSGRRYFLYALKAGHTFAARITGDELGGLLQQLRAQGYKRIYRRRVV